MSKPTHDIRNSESVATIRESFVARFQERIILARGRKYDEYDLDIAILETFLSQEEIILLVESAVKNSTRPSTSTAPGSPIASLKEKSQNKSPRHK
jgi:hypothetical protein